MRLVLFSMHVLSLKMRQTELCILTASGMLMTAVLAMSGQSQNRLLTYGLTASAVLGCGPLGCFVK